MTDILRELGNHGTLNPENLVDVDAFRRIVSQELSVTDEAGTVLALGPEHIDAGAMTEALDLTDTQILAMLTNKLGYYKVKKG